MKLTRRISHRNRGKSGIGSNQRPLLATLNSHVCFPGDDLTIRPHILWAWVLPFDVKAVWCSHADPLCGVSLGLSPFIPDLTLIIHGFPVYADKTASLQLEAIPGINLGTSQGTVLPGLDAAGTLPAPSPPVGAQPDTLDSSGCQLSWETASMKSGARSLPGWSLLPVEQWLTWPLSFLSSLVFGGRAWSGQDPGWGAGEAEVGRPERKLVSV